MIESMDEKNKNTNLQEREWPNTVRNRDELDSALEAGLKSGVSELTGRQIVDRALARIKNG